MSQKNKKMCRKTVRQTSVCRINQTKPNAKGQTKVYPTTFQNPFQPKNKISF